MRAAINVEAVCALLVLLFYVARQTTNNDRLLHASNPDRREWLLLLLVIPAAFLWTLSIPLLSDDFVGISEALRFTPDKIGGLFTIPASNRFFRPLGDISL